MSTRWIYNKTFNICGIYSSLEEEFEFCWSSTADEHNALPKSTRRNVELNKFAFGTPWLLDLLYKDWFTPSVWNFCGWVADVPPGQTPPATRSEEERLFSQAINNLFFNWQLTFSPSPSIQSLLSWWGCMENWNCSISVKIVGRLNCLLALPMLVCKIWWVNCY